MAGGRPSILVVDSERDERLAIAAVLREAGFAVVAAADERDAGAAMQRQRFAASVIALPGQGGVEFLRQARQSQPGLRALVVIDPATTRFVDGDHDSLVTRPFDPRQILG